MHAKAPAELEQRKGHFDTQNRLTSGAFNPVDFVATGETDRTIVLVIMQNGINEWPKGQSGGLIKQKYHKHSQGRSVFLQAL